MMVYSQTFVPLQDQKSYLVLMVSVEELLILRKDIRDALIIQFQINQFSYSETCHWWEFVAPLF